MLSRLISLRLPVLAIASVALLAAGCGVRDYNALMKRRLGSLRSAGKFKYLYGPTELPGTPISIRIPMIYSRSYQPDSAHEDDGPKINPARLQPPFLRLPSIKVCYEGATTAGESRLPHYCYLAAMPAQQGDVDRVLDQFAAQLKTAFPNAPASWETVNADTPDGYSIPWKKIRVEGSQQFLVKTGNQVEAKDLPGIFELWLYDAEDYIVIVAWRVPNDAQGPAELPAVTPGSPVFFPPEARLDLSMWPVLTAGTVTKSAAAAP